MSMPATHSHAPDPIQALRELIAGLDPECEVLVDEISGDVLVRGSIDPAQLDAAIKASGLGMRIADSAGESGGGCCGGCGCA
ncbi:MAG TPA: hypothetical protein PLJ91_07205 [Thermomonas sp.]|nr:hypothetical protein [Thermomonas sp.]